VGYGGRSRARRRAEAVAKQQEETVTIGDVFARAWDLWRRDVGWLILAGLVVGVIVGVLGAILYGILIALIAGAGAAVGTDALNSTRTSMTGFGLGLGITGLLVGVAGGFLIQVITLSLYGGMFEMVIGAYRGQRGVEFGDLFAGFRKFGSYALYAVVLAAIQFGLGLLNFLPLIGPIIAFVVSIWIMILWLYVLPLIADHGLGFMEAAGKSRNMVRSSGWWWTFGMIFLLGLAAVILVAIAVVVGVLLGKADTIVGIAVGLALVVVLMVLYAPYSICYVSVLYVSSGGEFETVPAGGGMGSIPLAPPAPPAYGGQGFGTPPSYSLPPAGPAGADAWKAAADPLASAPPPPSLASEDGSAPAPPPSRPPADDATAVAQTPLASEAAPAGPAAPEPPAPPPPPTT
jgi:hypothetical protein